MPGPSGPFLNLSLIVTLFLMYLDGNIEVTSISLLPILTNFVEKCVAQRLEFISNRLFALQHADGCLGAIQGQFKWNTGEQ